MQSDPFSITVQKLLQEKNQEKRQQGSQAVELAVNNALLKEDDKSIRNIIEFFKPWIQTANTNQKKAGFYIFQQITQVIVQSGQEQVKARFVKDLTQPILELIEVNDEKVRLQALECLNTMCKSLRELTLINFKNIFEITLDKAADYDECNPNYYYQLLQVVKKAQSILDNTLKNIIRDQASDCKYFNIEEFVNQLQRKFKTNSTPIKQQLLQWISTLQEIKSLQMYQYFPQLMENLFMHLDSGPQIRKFVDEIIINFRKEINSLLMKSNIDLRIIGAILDNLIKICNNQKTQAKMDAICWIHSFLESSNLLFIQESELNKIFLPRIPFILEKILDLLNHDEQEIRRAAEKTNDLLLRIMEKVKHTSIEFMNLFPVVEGMLTQKKIVAESALLWMDHLLRIYPEHLLPVIDSILSRVFEKLNDAEGSVLKGVMKVMGSVCLHDQYFDLVIDKILDVFHSNRDILQNKCNIIIKRFCSLLNPEKVYTAFASKILKKQEQFEIEFISQLVQILQSLLETDRDLYDLRQVLRNLRYEENRQNENIQTFETLFSTFSFNPVSTITLCFLVEEYELAYNIIKSLQNYKKQFISEIDLDTDTQNSIANLVNNLESSTFVQLRLQLLESNQHPYLLQCLYGLMMLLPQGRPAFNKLRMRLKYVQEQEGYYPQTSIPQKPSVEIDRKKMLDIFLKTKKVIYLYKKEQVEKNQ